MEEKVVDREYKSEPDYYCSRIRKQLYIDDQLIFDTWDGTVIKNGIEIKYVPQYNRVGNNKLIMYKPGDVSCLIKSLSRICKKVKQCPKSKQS